MGVELDSYGSEQGSIVGSCKYGIDPSGFIEIREFDNLRNYQPLKNESALWNQSELIDKAVLMYSGIL